MRRCELYEDCPPLVLVARGVTHMRGGDSYSATRPPSLRTSGREHRLKLGKILGAPVLDVINFAGGQMYRGSGGRQSSSAVQGQSSASGSGGAKKSPRS